MPRHSPHRSAEHRLYDVENFCHQPTIDSKASRILRPLATDGFVGRFKTPANDVNEDSLWTSRRRTLSSKEAKDYYRGSVDRAP